MVKFSGKKDVYKAGGTRDSSENKLKYDLLPTWPVAKAIAKVMTDGAKNHGVRNWERGINFSRLQESAVRHYNQFVQGETDEDHLTQSIINLMMLKHFILTGRQDLNDLPEYGILDE